MDPLKFLKRSWQLFVAQEDVGPWEYLWRRMRFFFDTNEKFRSESLMYCATLIITALIAFVLPWECARRFRRRNNIDLPTATEMIKKLEENRHCLQEITNLLTRPETVSIPWPATPLEEHHHREFDDQAADGPVESKIPVIKKRITTPGTRCKPKKIRSTPS